MSDDFALPTGTLLQGGKYKITRFISSGGFGCTYEAMHVMLGKRVAIKEFFVKSMCNRDDATKSVRVGTVSQTALVAKLKTKFIQEAQAVGMLSHENIVKVYDVFEENETAYYVMDFIEGKSLDAIIKDRGKLPEHEALDIVRQIGSALEHVHRNNRLHLDVKPGNVMVDDEGVAILIDFGTSKHFMRDPGQDTSTLLGHTPGYAPIEQMSGDATHLSPATDVYALAATLYKMLEGGTPIDSTLVASGQSQRPLPSDVSASTVAAIAHAMSVNMRQRPQSVAEFLAMLNGTHDNVKTVEATVYAENVDYAAKPSVPKRPQSQSRILNDDEQRILLQRMGMEVVEKPHRSTMWVWVIILLLAIAGAGAAIAYFKSQRTGNHRMYDDTKEEPTEHPATAVGGEGREVPAEKLVEIVNKTAEPAYDDINEEEMMDAPMQERAFGSRSVVNQFLANHPGYRKCTLRGYVKNDPDLQVTFRVAFLPNGQIVGRYVNEWIPNYTELDVNGVIDYEGYMQLRIGHEHDYLNYNGNKSLSEGALQQEMGTNRYYGTWGDDKYDIYLYEASLDW